MSVPRYIGSEGFIRDMLALIIREPVLDDEYEACKWRATNSLIQCRQCWEAGARDESIEDEVRVYAALCARAIREELAP